MDFVSLLYARGLIEQISDEAAIRKLFETETVSLYVGFDPTAPSLHVGHFLPIMVMAHLQRAGHRPIAVVGGATGMIGDPSGRSSERNLITQESVQANLNGIQKQLSRFLDFSGPKAAKMVNNADWTAPLSYIDWLRDVGKYFSVNYMMAKESVRRRLEERDQGISYTEFSYMLLQAHDFLHLFRHENCKIQGGGNDQWGNITAGIDLIHKAQGAQAYGFTFPLITTASGEKFGKSAGNAVWLDPKLTSPYQFYQYWLQTPDQDVERFLKLFTFLELNEIDEIQATHLEAPEKRFGQRRLAEEITRGVHGAESLSKVQQATEILFGSEIQGLSDNDLLQIFAEVPATEMPRTTLNELKLLDLVRESGLAKSNGEAKKLILAGGLYLNNIKQDDPYLPLQPAHLASESMLVLRSGKKKYHLARFV